MWKILLLFNAFVYLMILSGCQNDMPKPEFKPKTFLQEAKTVMAPKPANQGAPSLSVQYESKGNNVYVECIVTGITFRETDYSNNKTGKMIVWIDGRKTQEASAAAFIIKNLPAGNHQVKLEVVSQHNRPYGLSKEFMVNIPNR